MWKNLFWSCGHCERDWLFSRESLKQMSGKGRGCVECFAQYCSLIPSVQVITLFTHGPCCLFMLWSITCISNLCPHVATLLIKGPTEPVLEGVRITLECLYTDSDLNISQVHFEVFSKVSYHGNKQVVGEEKKRKGKELRMFWRFPAKKEFLRRKIEYSDTSEVLEIKMLSIQRDLNGSHYLWKG